MNRLKSPRLWGASLVAVILACAVMRVSARASEGIQSRASQAVESLRSVDRAVAAELESSLSSVRDDHEVPLELLHAVSVLLAGTHVQDLAAPPPAPEVDRPSGEEQAQAAVEALLATIAANSMSPEVGEQMVEVLDLGPAAARAVAAVFWAAPATARVPLMTVIYQLREDGAAMTPHLVNLILKPDATATERSMALVTLNRVGPMDPQATVAVLRCAANRALAPQVRADAIAVLAQSARQCESLRVLLAQAYKSAASQVREVALIALIRRFPRSTSTSAGFKHALEHESESLLIAAFRAMSESPLPPSAGLPFLRAGLQAQTPAVQLAALKAHYAYEALGTAHRDEIDQLASTSTDEPVQLEAAGLLQLLPAPPSKR